MVRMVSVQLSSSPSSGSLSGWSMVSASEERDTISQNTSRRRSTRPASRVTTSTPSLVPAVFTANTATTSRQSGGAPSMIIWS